MFCIFLNKCEQVYKKEPLTIVKERAKNKQDTKLRNIYPIMNISTNLKLL